MRGSSTRQQTARTSAENNTRAADRLGLPRLVEVLRTFSKPRPESAPHSYVGWPLWFVGGAFIHTRRAGGLLVLGLLLNALLPIHLPWV
jgi:1,4-dihydroxy-2-naphthoate octaprenyltransferase